MILTALALSTALSEAPRPPDSKPGSTPSRTVVVTGTLVPGTLAQSTREVLVLEAEQLQALPITTVGEALSMAASLDLQTRVPGALFGDVRMRGTHFGGVLVCIDGVRWNDPQTGHFNLEIPIPLEMVERIEVLTGSQCAFYGSEAVGGVINVITRRADGRREARLEGGSYGSGSAAALVEGVQGAWQGRVFGGYARSDGFAQNRDFATIQAAAEGSRTLETGHLRAMYTFLDQRFGAENFYGAFPSWEATTGHGLLLSAELDRGPIAGHAARVDATWRRHDDHFVLYRDRPALYENRHSNTTAQVKAVSVLFKGRGATLTGALEGGRDELASERLGDHHVSRIAGTVEWLQELVPGLSFQASLRGDHSSTWGRQWTPGAGLAWRATPTLKIRAAWGKAFRAPSFTELYYSSPAQMGNPNLSPERSRSLEAGADWLPGGSLNVSLTLFRRWDRDQIDWVRRNAGDPWTAANLGALRAQGASFQASGRPTRRLGASFGWSWTRLDLPAAAYASRYAPDCVRHHVTATLTAELPKAMRLSTTCTYKDRALPGSDPLLLSFRLGRAFGALETFLQGENLLDRRWEELQGIPLPGRTFSAGLRWRSPAR